MPWRFTDRVMKKSSIKSTLQDFFHRYPGSEIVKNLKDGASLNVSVGRHSFTVVKKDGDIAFENGEYPADISVKLNKSALEFICSSRDIDDLISRVKKCTKCDDDSYVFSYRVNASIPAIIAKGYFAFARRIGLF